jgi:hypothetical protein
MRFLKSESLEDTIKFLPSDSGRIRVFQDNVNLIEMIPVTNRERGGDIASYASIVDAPALAVTPLRLSVDVGTDPLFVVIISICMPGPVNVKQDGKPDAAWRLKFTCPGSG